MCSPTGLQRGFLCRKQSFLCVWKLERVSIPLRRPSNRDPNSCRNSPDSLWECKPLPCSWVGGSLKVDNQCLCEAKLVPTDWAQCRSTAQPPRLRCRSCAEGPLSRGHTWITGEGARGGGKESTGRLWMHTYLHNQRWIVRDTCAFSVDYVFVQVFIFKLGKASAALWDCLATMRSLHRQLTGRPHLFLCPDSSNHIRWAACEWCQRHCQTTDISFGVFVVVDWLLWETTRDNVFRSEQNVSVASKCLVSFMHPSDYPPVASFSLSTPSRSLSVRIQSSIDWTEAGNKRFLLIPPFSYYNTGSSWGGGSQWVSQGIRQDSMLDHLTCFISAFKIIKNISIYYTYTK